MKRLILVSYSPTLTSNHCEMIIVANADLKEIEGRGNGLFSVLRPPWFLLGFSLNSCSELGRMSPILALNSPIIETSSVYILAPIRTYRNMRAHTQRRPCSTNIWSRPIDKLADGSSCVWNQSMTNHMFTSGLDLVRLPSPSIQKMLSDVQLDNYTPLFSPGFNCSYITFAVYSKYYTGKLQTTKNTLTTTWTT